MCVYSTLKLYAEIYVFWCVYSPDWRNIVENKEWRQMCRPVLCVCYLSLQREAPTAAESQIYDAQ
jgi:hypothetical protein